MHIIAEMNLTIIIIITRHFSHKSSNSKAHIPSIRIKKNVKSITKKKSIGSVIQIKINQNVQAKIESIVSV